MALWKFYLQQCDDDTFTGDISGFSNDYDLHAFFEVVRYYKVDMVEGTLRIIEGSGESPLKMTVITIRMMRKDDDDEENAAIRCKNNT